MNIVHHMKQAIAIVSCSLLFACAESYDAEQLEAKYTNTYSKFVMLDRNRVHYRDEGQGEAIILIHGTASSLHTWDHWSEKLKQDYRVIRMDLPGFGLTGPDRNERYEVSDDVAFLKSFLDKLDIQQAHLVGSSLGGRIAWQFAIEHQHSVSSLTLINSLGYHQEKWPPPIEMAQWPVMDKIMERFSPRFMYEIGLRDVYHDSAMVDENLVERYFELSRYPGNLAAFPARVKARLDKDSSLISRVSVPTLILWGQEDKYFPAENAFRFQRDIRDSQVRVYKDVGHLPMEEAPDRSLQDLLDFLTSSVNPAVVKVSNDVN